MLTRFPIPWTSLLLQLDMASRDAAMVPRADTGDNPEMVIRMFQWHHHNTNRWGEFLVLYPNGHVSWSKEVIISFGLLLISFSFGLEGRVFELAFNNVYLDRQSRQDFAESPKMATLAGVLLLALSVAFGRSLRSLIWPRPSDKPTQSFRHCGGSFAPKLHLLSRRPRLRRTLQCWSTPSGPCPCSTHGTCSFKTSCSQRRHGWKVGLSLILDLSLLMRPLPGHRRNLGPHQKTRGEKRCNQKAPAPGGVGA